MRILAGFLFVLVLLPAAAVAEEIRIVSPDLKDYGPWKQTQAGVDLALGDEIGVAGYFDTIFADDGPGHATFGVLAVIAIDDDDRSNCDDDEVLFGAAGRVKYVFDIHPQIRPWGGVGIGVYASSDDDDCGDNDDDVGIGIPVSLGVDFALAKMSLVVSANWHQTTTDEDISYLGLGVAFPF